MENQNGIGKKSGRRALYILVYLSLVFSLGLLPGCSPKAVEKIRTEYVYRDVHHRDTTIQHDSTYIREYIKGDTVHHYEYRDRYLYRDRWRDSIVIQQVHDTTTVEKLVEKKFSAGQKAKINSFWYLLIGLFGFAVWTFRKPILKLIKLL